MSTSWFESSTGARKQPKPVLLVPGWSDRAARLAWWRARFLAEGWLPSEVAVVDFRDRYGSNREHSAEIAAVHARLLAATGADLVDIVAHSMGGLAVRHFLHSQRDPRVRRVVFTGTPHVGTWAAYLGWGAGARDMRPGSAFLQELAARPPVPAGVEALCIHTPADTRILPQRSALLPGFRCRRVWCPSHAGMLRSGRVFAAIRTFLAE